MFEAFMAHPVLVTVGTIFTAIIILDFIENVWGR